MNAHIIAIVNPSKTYHFEKPVVIAEIDNKVYFGSAGEEMQPLKYKPYSEGDMEQIARWSFTSTYWFSTRYVFGESFDSPKAYMENFLSQQFGKQIARYIVKYYTDELEKVNVEFQEFKNGNLTMKDMEQEIQDRAKRVIENIRTN